MPYLKAKNNVCVNVDHITHIIIKAKTAEVYIVGDDTPFVVEENQMFNVLQLVQGPAVKPEKK
ncbi:MAG TPA: hypothetical protein VHC20_05195 [Candidatus Paceibacterota bacterium]|nr:hypothetical protein [Candidatus Paceibacterota bacterium]